MAENNGSDTGAFLAGFVIGGLVGAAAALIMAPQSGEETRARIAERGDYLRRTGEERLHDYRVAAESYAGQAQEQARIVLDEGRGRMTESLERGQEQADRIAERSKVRIHEQLGQIRRKSADATEELEEAATAAVDSARETVDETAEAAIEKVDEATESAKEAVDEAAEAAKERLAEEQDKGDTAPDDGNA